MVSIGQKVVVFNVGNEKEDFVIQEEAEVPYVGKTVVVIPTDRLGEYVIIPQLINDGIGSEALVIPTENMFGNIVTGKDLVWSDEVIDSGAISFTDIIFDSDDVPHVTYVGSSGVVMYGYKNGSWSTENVSGTTNDSSPPSITLDSSDNPHIAYISMAYPGPWDIDTVTSTGTGHQMHSSIVVDSHNCLHVAYYDYTNSDLKYAYFDGWSWSTETVDSTGFIGYYPSIALDSSDNPHISYVDVTSVSLKYATKDGSWSTETVDSTTTGFTSIAIDSNDNIHIAYHDELNENLKYAYHDGSWSTETVDNSGNIQYGVRLAVGSDDYPRIVYQDTGTTYIRFAEWNGSSWDKENVTTNGYFSYTKGLALDSSDNPHISYYNSTADELKYATKDGSWSTETVDTDGDVGRYCDLALDSSDNPHISYSITLSGLDCELKYATKDGSWSTETVDNDTRVGEYGAIAIDIFGYPKISYHDRDNGNLKVAMGGPSENSLYYSYLVGGSWSHEIVDSAGGFRSQTIKLDSDGYPRILYRVSGSPKNLKFARWNGSSWGIETIASEGLFEYRAYDIDSDDRDHVMYYVESTDDLKYAYYDGSWNIETIENIGSVEFVEGGLAVDDNNIPHVTYYDSQGDLKYATKDGSWSIETIVNNPSGTLYESSMYLDSYGYPHVTYLEDINLTLYYTYYNGSGWSTPASTIIEEYVGLLALDSHNRKKLVCLDLDSEGGAYYIQLL
ncbi:MAG: hypothetical protein SVK08_01290 [Halobacteriota archaeon]|nr:hypothetical protein [Halobacteriota archaeon]